ncbi:MAG: response regulator [Desulfobacterales bacterium]|jgi:PAS domain S-box-containing protein
MVKKALVVDADYFFVEFVSELLTKRGYAVTKAYDGKDGISKLENLPHDVMFVDLVMPKVDGSQFIDFVRLKYGPNHFPIVALSGVMVEQLGSLNEIGADYYIAKGPIDKLTVQLNGLMAEIETRPQAPSNKAKVMQTAGVYPRRDAVGLLNALKFHQAVIESMAVGVIVVDIDARIVNVNPVAFEILGQSPTEVLNHRVLDIFPLETRPKLGSALKQVKQLPDRTKISFISDFNNRTIRTSVSVISLSSGDAGWVLVLEDTTCA